MELPPVRFATASDGVRIAYMRWPGTGPPFLSVNTPGVPPMSLRTRFGPYQHTARSTGREMVWFDWRGSGQSDRRAPECMEDLVRDLEAVTDAIGEAPDAMVLNLACLPACMFAASRPEAWRSLLLVDPSMTAAANTVAFVSRPGWEVDHQAQLRVIARTSGLATGDELEALVQDWAQTVPLQSQAAYRSVESGADLTELLPHICLPTIVTNRLGRPDPEVAAALPRALLVEYGENERIPAFLEIWQRHMPPMLGELASASASPAYDGVVLTEREVQVLASLADGLRNADIAMHLILSTRTVEHHIANIYGKLGVHNRVEAANWAREHGVG